MRGRDSPLCTALREWSPDGKHYAFLASNNGPREIYELYSPRAFMKPVSVKLTQSALDITAFTISRDSQRIFAIEDLRQATMLEFDPKRKSFVPFMNGLPAEEMDVSPDGQWEVYEDFPPGCTLEEPD